MFSIEMFEIERCKIKPKVKVTRTGKLSRPTKCASPPTNQAPTNLPPTRTGKLSRPTNETFAKFRVFRE